jgi:hypothetical protein
MSVYCIITDAKCALGLFCVEALQLITTLSNSVPQNPRLSLQKNEAASRILERVEEERVRLHISYQRLQKEVLGRYEKATEAKINAERSWQLLKLGRQVQRICTIARQYETSLTDSGLGSAKSGKEDYRLLVSCTYTTLAFREIISGVDGPDLGRVELVKVLRGRVFEDGDVKLLDYARRVIREFSMSSLMAPNVTSPTYRETEDSRARFSAATHMLYLLSPAPRIDGKRMVKEDFEPDYLLRALQSYIQSAVTSSSAAMGRALGQLPTLDRALLEVSARCQNVVALEVFLKNIRAPDNPMLSETLATASSGETLADEVDDNLLKPLLHALDTSSLTSYFWRSLASSLSARVQEILNRGGVVARTLKSNRENIRNDIRECVLRGSKMPSSILHRDRSSGEELVGNWEREAAVMVGSVIGPLGR